MHLTGRGFARRMTGELIALVPLHVVEVAGIEIIPGPFFIGAPEDVHDGSKQASGMATG